MVWPCHQVEFSSAAAWWILLWTEAKECVRNQRQKGQWWRRRRRRPCGWNWNGMISGTTRHLAATRYVYFQGYSHVLQQFGCGTICSCCRENAAVLFCKQNQFVQSGCVCPRHRSTVVVSNGIWCQNQLWFGPPSGQWFLLHNEAEHCGRTQHHFHSGRTFIRSDSKWACANIFSYDANALYLHYIADIGKSSGPRSVTDKNSGGPVKPCIEAVRLSGKKFPYMEKESPSVGNLERSQGGLPPNAAL